MEIEFDGAVWYWRGPSPYHFVTVPEAPSDLLAAASLTLSPDEVASLDAISAV